ncbi:alpha/beta hydrolase family protein [Halalkalibacter alkaliphilus]|uniref:Prolyl oligopeptidase family serine peptidase n=1 Tax=Halalkalibacter alkaliphilus TaxID=2917993 RepID=A0A9X2CTD9_9BACI|nr:prolyl oligopeptidase family serine peptidase [Halalkalibacter alkaliphilus]MCL7747886.1 prolyl oligopeptidase family serine peptidase [Halalkalibacter alkaliphilus]
MNLIDKVRIPSPHPKIKLFEITYLSSGLKVKGYLAIPTWGERFPGLLYLRGGIKTVGMVRIQRVIQWAAEGMVVVAPFYRGNKGGEGQEDFCGEDREDAFAAFDLMKNMIQVDSSSLHILGFSRGGVMALLTAIKRPETTSVVCWNGVSDMVLTYEERIDLRRMMKRVIGGTPSKYPDRYEWRTPLGEIKNIRGNVLVIHGEKDEHVSIEHAYRLEYACHSSDVNIETWYYPVFHHHFPASSQRQILSEAAMWMKKSFCN